MRRLKTIILWVAGCGLLILAMSFSASSLKMVKTNGIAVEVDYSEDIYFTDASEIEEIVRAEYPFFDSLNLQEINIPLLEESIENHPSIRGAEVYSTLNGSLRIKVAQKKPLARIQHSGTGYYIDEEGEIMQLSERFSASVPLVAGELNEESRKKVYHFWKWLEGEAFFDNFFMGLEVADNGEWILYPRPGNHRVLLGQPEDLPVKIRRLQKFYQTVVTEKNLDSIKTLNTKYRGQIICSKHQ